LHGCTVDSASCPALKRQLKKLEKKYRKIRSDLEESIPEIERDYQSACYPARIPRLKLKYEVWKYSFGSTDLRRHPRDSFRIIGVFLDEDKGEKRTMIFILCYFKGDKEDVTAEEISKAVQEMLDP
jgi:hypothetical protein